MPRHKLIALAVMACAMAVFATTAGADYPDHYMLRKVNNARHAHGLGKLHVSRNLEHSAGAYARYLMAHQYFGHSSRIHASSRWHRLGEILELQYGLRPHVKRAYRCWMHSSDHRNIILDGGWSSMGAGRASGWFRGHKMTIWVIHFGHH